MNSSDAARSSSTVTQCGRRSSRRCAPGGWCRSRASTPGRASSSRPTGRSSLAPISRMTPRGDTRPARSCWRGYQPGSPEAGSVGPAPDPLRTERTSRRGGRRRRHDRGRPPGRAVPRRVRSDRDPRVARVRRATPGRGVRASSGFDHPQRHPLCSRPRALGSGERAPGQAHGRSDPSIAGGGGPDRRGGSTTIRRCAS